MRGVGDIHLQAVLTGISFGMDGVSQICLFFAVPIWVVCSFLAVSSLQGQQGAKRFLVWFAATCAGNIGLILSQDMVSFYLCFAFMTFAAYPLVVHEGTKSAHYAGKVYLTMAVIGETMLISAMMMIGAHAVSTAFSDVVAAIQLLENRDLVIGLLLGGFGIKVGALSLHMWMPLAYAAAPTAASAALSGVVVKAGILGWLRFLPLGGAALSEWGSLMIAAGLAAAFYGVAVGLTQNEPKVVLAYSSISQMGIMTAGLGIGLTAPDLSSAVVQAILLYSIHHALNKAALFAGVAVADASSASSRRRIALICLLVPSLGLAGAPFTSGAAAKAGLNDVAVLYEGQFHLLLDWLLPVTSVATTILMGRFLWVVHATQPGAGFMKNRAGLWLPWLVLLVFSVVAGLVLPFDELNRVLRNALSLDSLVSSIWPVALGTIALLAAWYLRARYGIRLRITIPPGDLLVGVAWILGRIKFLWNSRVAAVGGRSRHVGLTPTATKKGELISGAALTIERLLSLWVAAGIAIILAVASLVIFFVVKG